MEKYAIRSPEGGSGTTRNLTNFCGKVVLPTVPNYTLLSIQYVISTNAYIHPLPRYLGCGGGSFLNRIVTVFGQKEFATLQVFCKRKRLSMYALAKASIREYVLRHT